jgi:hypothetical protein
LLLKLKRLGITDHHHKLIESYLSDRQVFTEVNDKSSNLRYVRRGVPQGGSLSSTLFNAYTADIQYIDLHGKLSLFADDSNIINNAKSVALLKKNVEHDLALFADWCSANDMILNLDKTMLMLSSRIPTNTVFSQHNPMCNNHLDCQCPTLQIVNQYKYLGIILDSSLTFQYHIDAVVKKLRNALAALYKLADWNRRDIALKFYHACFQSHVDYCLSAWGHVTIARRNRILLLQKHALRLIYQKNRNSPSAPLFASSKILPFQQRFIYRLSLFVYKMMMRKELITIANSHRYHLTGKLLLPAQHCRMYSRSIMVTAIRIFNWYGHVAFDKKISLFKTEARVKLNQLAKQPNGLDHLIDGCWTQ